MSARPEAPPAQPKTPRRRWREWLINLTLIAIVVVAVQWWKSRPLAEGAAPPLAGVTLDGTALDVAELRGAPVLVHFWASWCPVCKLTDGVVDGIAEDHAVVTVAMQSGGADELRRFTAEAGLGFRVIPDPEARLAAAWGVSGVPTTFVLDANGRIRYSTVGASTGPGLRARLWLARSSSLGGESGLE